MPDQWVYKSVWMKWRGCHAGHQEVSRCQTRGEWADITRSPPQGYQVAPQKGLMSSKIEEKKNFHTLLFQRGSPEGPGSAAHSSSRQDGRKHHQLPQDSAAVNHLLGADEGPDILTSGRTQHGHGQHDQGEYTVGLSPVADPGFPRGGGANCPGAPTYDFTKFSKKLHDIQRIWAPGHASLVPP